jgi:uncharacterized protein (DUF1499 family)
VADLNIKMSTLRPSSFHLPFSNFVDDLEIRFSEENKTIHIRSASRVGTSYFGVNNKSVEKLKNS